MGWTGRSWVDRAERYVFCADDGGQFLSGPQDHDVEVIGLLREAPVPKSGTGASCVVRRANRKRVN